MSLAGFKKQMTKANQLLSEKIGGIKGTELDSEYLTNEKIIDNYKSLFDEILLKITEYLQPNLAHRTKLLAAKTLHKISGKEGEKPLYPQAEGQISEMFAKYGNESRGNLFGDSLMDISETFKELEDKKYGLEDMIMQNFIGPVSKLRNNEIKEISMHRKKVQSRRLTFDALKRNKEKGAKVVESELDDAHKKFEESKELASEAMMNFLDSEAEHINIIAAFIRGERDYHHEAADIFESLYAKLMSKRDEANSSDKKRSSRVPTSHSYSKTTVSDDNSSGFNSPIGSSAGVGSNSPNPTFVFKKGYDSQSTTPCCRALYDFAAESANELAFSEGDVVKLIQQVDENWFEGEIRGQTGFFPVNFVEVLVPLKD